MKYTCGIDWASDHHDVSIMNNSGMEVKRFRISNDYTGYNQLMKALKVYKLKPPIAIECKEHLIISFLVSEGFTIYSINPKSLDRYKDRYNVAGNKTDPIDALALADVCAQIFTSIIPWPIAVKMSTSCRCTAESMINS